MITTFFDSDNQGVNRRKIFILELLLKEILKPHMRYLIVLIVILFYQLWLPAQWVSTGGPYGGFISHLQQNERFLFLQANDNIYRSENSGDSWINVLDAEHRGIRTLNFAVRDSIILSLAQIDSIPNYPILFRSTDYGENWVEIGMIEAFPSYLVHQGNLTLNQDNIIFYNSTRLLQSTNNGLTWMEPNLQSPINEFGAVKSYEDTLFVGGARGQLLILPPLGSNWSIFPTPLSETITHFLKFENNLLVGGNSEAYHSLDGGTTWTSINPIWVDYEGEEYNQLINNADTLIAWSKTGTGMESIDWGLSWAEIGADPLGKTAYSMIFHKNSFFRTDFQNIYRTDATRENWLEVNVGIPNAQVHDLAATSNGIVASTLSGLSYYDFSSHSWSAQKILSTKSTPTLLGTLNEYIFTVVDQELLRTNDLGVNWDTLDVDFQFPLVHNKKESDIFSFDNRLFLYSVVPNHPQNTQLFVSSTNGDSWNMIDFSIQTNGVSARKIIPFQESLILAANDGSLFQSLDHGSTWTLLPSDLRSITNFNNLEDFYGSGEYLLALVNVFNNQSVLYISIDGGSTFEKANFGIPGNIIWHPQPLISGFAAFGDNLVTGYDLRFRFSYDEGKHWFPSSFLFNKGHVQVAKLLKAGNELYAGNIHGVYTLEEPNLLLKTFNGYVFIDDNDDGNFNEDEKGLSNVILNFENEVFSISDSNGYYSMKILKDQIGLISPSFDSPFIDNITPASYMTSSWDSTVNFAVKLIPDKLDMVLNLTDNAIFRPGFSNILAAKLSNNGTVPFSSYEFRLTLAEGLSFVNASLSPSAVNGQELIWNFEGLQIGDLEEIMIELYLNEWVPISSEICINGEIITGEEEEVLDNNYLETCTSVVGSFDPNDKRVQPAIYTTANLESKTPLIYTIRFQNTGNYLAETVRITDQISPHLDLNTFTFIGSSHDCTYSIQPFRTLEFLFKEIDLPDSLSNEPNSHGYIVFSILPNTNVSNSDEIENNADIYFDFNSPIKTNTTSTIVAQPNSTSDFRIESTLLIVFPNPAQGFCTASIDKPVINGILSIINAKGQVVQNSTVSGTEFPVSIKSLPGGWYTIRVWDQNENRQFQGRLLIE